MYTLIPPSSDRCLVFPMSNRDFQYETTAFSPAICEGRLTQSDVNSFFDAVRRETKTSLDKLIFLAQARRTTALMSLLLFVLGIILVAVGFAIRYRSGTRLSTAGFIICFVTAILSFIINIWCIGLRTHNYATEYITALRRVITQQNQTYQSRQVRWVPENSGRWIELWLDFRIVNPAYAQSLITTGQPYMYYQQPPPAYQQQMPGFAQPQYQLQPTYQQEIHASPIQYGNSINGYVDIQEVVLKES